MAMELEERLQRLAERGVELVDPRQVYVSDDVDLDRIMPGARLFPGARLEGAQTLVGPNALIGTEGPATLCNSAVGTAAEVASGYLNETTMLARSRAGANAHFRAGTLLEEEASTAHAVGLKQTILMCYATLGSLINFCDGLVSGGRSRKEHSEIGSGFIHFNFTPWGQRGDKATPSLVGNVVDGVFLDQERIFLGGLSGLVGPESVGFGALTVAGQVIRQSVAADTLHSEAARDKTGAWRFGRVDRSPKRVLANISYLVQLEALRVWYREVRCRRAKSQKDGEVSELVLEHAINTIACCIEERVARFNAFASERDVAAISSADFSSQAESAPDVDWKPELEHTEWVRSLGDDDKTQLRAWMGDFASTVERQLMNKVGG